MKIVGKPLPLLGNFLYQKTDAARQDTDGGSKISYREELHSSFRLETGIEVALKTERLLISFWRVLPGARRIGSLATVFVD
jgi:hypothetical protein